MPLPEILLNVLTYCKPADLESHKLIAPDWGHSILWNESRLPKMRIEKLVVVNIGRALRPDFGENFYMIKRIEELDSFQLRNSYFGKLTIGVQQETVNALVEYVQTRGPLPAEDVTYFVGKPARNILFMREPKLIDRLVMANGMIKINFKVKNDLSSLILKEPQCLYSQLAKMLILSFKLKGLGDHKDLSEGVTQRTVINFLCDQSAPCDNRFLAYFESKIYYDETLLSLKIGDVMSGIISGYFRVSI